jgi:glutathione S-transferase
MGAAPVIQDSTASGQLITLAETPACAEYIMQVHGGGRLALPPSHPDYAAYLYWFHFANSNLQSQMSTSFRFGRSNATDDDVFKKTTVDRKAKVLAFIDSRLSNVPWLAGQEFTAADIMSVFSLTTMRVFAPTDLAPYPNILKYLERVGERPAYKRSMAKADPGIGPYLGADTPPEFMDSLK